MSPSPFDGTSEEETFGGLSKTYSKVCRRRCCFFSWIVICDETWAHHYTSESKQASMEWQRKRRKPKWKPRLNCQLPRFFQPFFFDRGGILSINFFAWAMHNHWPYYCKLLNEVRAAYRRKKQNQPIQVVVLLHNNAKAHAAPLTVSKLEEMHCTQFDHLFYSPKPIALLF